MDFYEARMSEGMSMDAIDNMDIGYYLKIKTRKSNEKLKQKAAASTPKKLVYIDDLDFL